MISTYIQAGEVGLWTGIAFGLAFWFSFWAAKTLVGAIIFYIIKKK